MIGLVIVHAMLLGWCAQRDGFTSEEVAHLPSGLFHWERGDFGMFNVNPPLVRMVATVPLLAIGYKADWSGYLDTMLDRPERSLSTQVLQQNGVRSLWLLTVARWTCIPFSLLGMFICWQWASELYSDYSAMLAAALWCFSPSIVGHGHLMAPDVAATAVGITAFYIFRRWLIAPTWRWGLLSGFALGQAEATKSTWIVLFALWPSLWLLWRIRCNNQEHRPPMFQEFKQMTVILLVAVWSINLWYGFSGTFTPLGDYHFLSKALGGGHSGDKTFTVDNRFKDSWLGSVPVPFPKDYVQGIDRQKFHFERPDGSYLRGEWRDRGWWHYYLYALFVKEPLGFWLLGGMSVLLGAAVPSYRARWREELLLLIPLVVLLLFISSQRGFNRHMRYVIIVLPFAFILMSRVARSISLLRWKTTAMMMACITWGIVSSVCVYPHSLSYFNEVAGGPRNGHYHLLSSNTDFGQDLLYLKSWIEQHPEARPLHLAWYARFVEPSLVGIEFPEVPMTPTPGWHAISVNWIQEYGDRYRYFLNYSPHATAGYSIFIYHLSESDCQISGN